MSQISRGPVVIDTGVFGAQLTRRTWPLGESYQPLVEGRAALVSFVTVAELRLVPGWLRGDRNGCESSITSWSERKPSGPGQN
jgi:hypothetical protein